MRSSLDPQTDMYTGADLNNLCREAAMVALRGMREASVVVSDISVLDANGHSYWKIDYYTSLIYFRRCSIFEMRFWWSNHL